MKKLITIIFAFACIGVFGQSVQWRNLNTSQIGSNLFLASIKRGAPITNPVVRGSFTNDQGTGLYFTDGNGLLKGQVTPYTGPNIPGLQLHASSVKVLELLTNLVSFSQNAVFSGTITGNGAGLTNLNANSATGMVENVLYYGADRTGSANSYSAFTNAIARSAVSGYPVYVPSGLYSLTNKLTLPSVSNFKIYGDGLGKSILSYSIAAGSGRGFEFPGTAMTNTTIYGLTIMGATKGGTNLATIILLATNATDIKIWNCELRNSITAIGKSSRANHKVWVKECVFADLGINSTGNILLEDSDNVTIEDSLFDDRGNGGTNYGFQNGIYVLSGNNLKIKCNTFLGTNVPITIGNAGNTLFLTNAQVTGNLLNGTHVNTLSFLVDSMVANNVWDVSGPVSVSKTFNLKFHNNFIRSSEVLSDTNTGGNLLSFTTSTNAMITANRLIGYQTNSGSVGILIDTGSTNCVIEDNWVTGTQTQLRFNAGNNSTVRNNTFETPIGPSTLKSIYVTTATNILFTGNRTMSATGWAYQDDNGNNRAIDNSWEGGGAVSAGGSVVYNPGGLITSSVTSRVQTGASAIGLTTNTIPARLLVTTGDSLTGLMAGTNASNANNKRLQLYLDTALLFDTGSLALSNNWGIRFNILRASDSSVRAFCSYEGDTTLLPTIAGQYVNAAVSTSLSTVANVLKVVATGVSDGDVVQTLSLVNYIPKTP